MRREGQVRVAAPEVDDPQRPVGRRGLDATRGDRVVDHRREVAQELLDLAVLRLPARLQPSLRVGEPDRRQQRVVLRQQPRLHPVVLVSRLRRVSAATHRRAPSPRPSWSPAAGGSRSSVSTCQFPNGSPSSGSTAAGRLAGLVVRGVRLGVVVRRDLEPPAGLEVDVAKLHAPPARLCPAPAARPDRPHEHVLVEQQRPHPREGGRKRFGGHGRKPRWGRGGLGHPERAMDRPGAQS